MREYCLAYETARAAGAAGAFDGRGRGHSGDVLHLLAEHVQARRRSTAATGCWCTAAPRASAPPRSCWPRRSAPRSSPPPARRRNARRPGSSAPTSRSITRPRTSSPMTKEATGGTGANLIVDMVGGDYIDRNYDCRGRAGRIVQVAFTGGPKATANFASLMRKRLHAHRLDAAPAHHRGEGRDRARHRGEGLAAGRGRQDQAGDRLHLSAGQGRRGPCPHGDEPAHRQDRADGVSSAGHLRGSPHG